MLWNELSNHCQIQIRDYQFFDVLQVIVCDQLVYRYDISVRCEFCIQWQNQECIRIYYYVDCKFGWYWQGIVYFVIDSGQNWIIDDDLEWVQCLILFRFYGQIQNGVFNVMNCKEVQ